MTRVHLGLEKIRAALQRISVDFGCPVDDEWLTELAGDVVLKVDLPRRLAVEDEKRKRLAAFAASAARFLPALNTFVANAEDAKSVGLRDPQKYASTLYYAIQRASLHSGRTSEPPRRGRPQRLDALGVAISCKWAFEECSSTRAKLDVDRVTGKARGAYLDLVALAFEALGIDANSEHYAREALKEK